jgi:tetratricopeptide (TPR) repeat protein
MKSPILRLRQFPLFLPAILVIWFAASAAQAKDNWISVRTQNFLLVSNAGEKDVRQVATKLEQFRNVFTRLFPKTNFNTPVPTTVIIFKSTDSYKPFALPNAAGYFQKGEDVNYITMSTDPTQDPFSIIYHEYVHLLVDNQAGNAPAWFNEGLAEYYSTFAIEEGRKVHLGELIPYHLQMLREGGKLYPLRTLFAVDQYSPEYNEGSKRGMFYAESWALVHYLILGNKSQRLPQLGKFVNLLRAEKPIDDAFAEAFQTDVATLEKELKKYIEGHSFMMQVATFEHKLEFENEFTVTPLSEADAQAYLGDLQLHVRRLNDAEKHLQQALSLDPKQPMALASLGILRARQGRFDEAKKSLQEAANANSGNYLVHYYYAYALSREGMDANNVVYVYAQDNAAKMRSELLKAIELNPSFPESYSLLAFVNTVTGEDLDGTVQILKKALTLAPGRQDLSLMLAQVHMRQQKLDLAKQLLEPLRSAKDHGIKAQAESMLVSIKNYEDSMSRFNAGGPAGAPELRERKSDVTTTDEAAAAEPPSQSDLLREALQHVEPGQEQIQGAFLKLECDNRAIAYFIVQTADRLYKIRATALERVQLMSYVDSGGELTCGARKNPENVVITFRPTNDPKDVRAKINGDAIAMALVPKDFQLKPK